MNGYQRFKLVQDCQCSIADSAELPMELLQAAHQGNVDMIKEYIDKDGNVNAGADDECLLSRACAEGQIEIVKLLLQCPDVHLNLEFEGSTPLHRAVKNGHMECVKLLIDAPVSCHIKPRKCWKAVAKCLKMYPQIQHRSAVHLLRCSSNKGNWVVIEAILEMKHHFGKEDLYYAILLAVDQNRWDFIRNVFMRDFVGKTELMNEVFALTVNMRDWGKVKEVLQIIDSDLKFDVSFVEAALAGNCLKCQRLLSERQYDSQILNGNLLVVAADGICEPLAELLMNIKNVYTKKTFSSALFLAANRYCAELLPKLLHNSEASYSLHDMQQAYEVLIRLPGYKKRDGLLVKYFRNSLNTLQFHS